MCPHPRSFCLYIFVAACFSVAFSANAQQNSEYGWGLSPRDTLRILVFFVEIDYDESPDLDRDADGNRVWPKGELPAYADELFDPFYKEHPEGRLTDYYREISLGNLVVLGDYYPELIREKYSDVGSSPSTLMNRLSKRFGADTAFVTKHGLVASDFDFWEQSPGPGQKKVPVTEGFEGVDHVMIIFRNYHRIPSDNGQANTSSSIRIAGQRSNTYSMFGGGRRFPFGIMRHELNHLFLGGNNFHAGGGNSAVFRSYQLHVQGGWAMMGAANSSLLTCTGWDRYRMGWKAPDKKFLVSALDAASFEVNGNLSATDITGEGVYILRDFVVTGDVLRIKLPFIPEEEFQQWLWIENHTTRDHNGSQFDVFQFQHNDCVSDAVPGLFLQMQIDAETKEGSNVYGSVIADYLRPVPANGSFDFIWEDEPLQTEEYCVNGVAYRPYTLSTDFENPLTGNHELELSLRDDNPPFGILDKNDQIVPMTRRRDGGLDRLNFNGSFDHAFFEGGNESFGIGTNPSSASVLTLVNNRRPRTPDSRNNRTVYLNGISFKILETFPDRSVKIEVRFDDHRLMEDRRWCAPDIVLNNHNPAGPDLSVEAELSLARGLTPVRLDAPDTLPDGTSVFNDATRLRTARDAELNVAGRIHLRDDSRLIQEGGSVLSLARGSRMILSDSAQIHVKEGAKVSGKGRFKIRKGAVIECEDEETYRHIRRRTCQKKRVRLGGG